MRNRREIYVLIVTAAILVVVLAGFFYFDSDTTTTSGIAPERQQADIDAPQEVDETPPGATGTIDDP